MNLPENLSGRNAAILALLGVSVLANLVFLTRGGSAVETPAPEVVAQVESEASVEVAEAAPAAVVADPDAIVPIEQLAVPAPPSDLEVVGAVVEHSLARTFQGVDAERGDVLAAIYARLFVWDVDLRSDLQRGDEVKVAFRWDGELADIEAATFRSRKLDQTFSAFRYHATGDAFASWWNADAQEATPRLKNGPIEDYEQVTALLKDRPKHRGMDFKTPVGTPVMSPKAGEVVRTNWNLKYNGGCIEVRFDDGTLARFLHLDDASVSAGQRVKAGQVIARSGNTGRSTAPHLHYELERNGVVVDPVDYHGTTRRMLPDIDRAKFEAHKSSLEQLISR